MRKQSTSVNKRLARGLVILYEDRDILVVDKPPGLLTVGTDSDKSRTAYFILTDYVRKGGARSRNRVFIVHRLDRETSGVLVFANARLALHARAISFKHPSSGKHLIFSTKVPGYFSKLVGSIHHEDGAASP